MTGDILYIGFSIFIFNIHNGFTLPHEYCLSPLNTSDCGQPMTPVFTYYKPGSRCEIEFWRGCPTINKFKDEFICSHFCIAKLWGGIDIDTNELGSIEEVPTDPCSKPIDTEDCGSTPSNVYTYDGFNCKMVVWRGCNSANMFEDYDQCVAICKPTLEEWKEEIQSLNLETIEKIDKFLDEVVETVKEEIPEAVLEVVTEREKLVLHIDEEPNVEEEEVTEAEEPEEEITETEEPTTEEPAVTEDDDSGEANEVETT